ncbi:MAG: DUF4405 domain-containing protein [Firmicutes bacterium]|nr:DUF4405 domain-containing protein [Bacillota bacterium]
MERTKRKALKITKICLDAVMLILLLLSMRLINGNVLLHEVLGYVLLSLFVLHLSLNFKSIKKIVPLLFSWKIKLKTKFAFLINFTLLAQAVIILISGFIISGVIYHPRAEIGQWLNIHRFVAYSFLILASVHLGLHIPVRRILNNKKIPLAVAKTALAVVVIVAGGIGVFTLGFTSERENIVAPFTYKNEVNSALSGGAPSGKYSYPDAVYEDESGNELTLKEFLSRLRCTACSKFCPLTLILCNKGFNYISGATAQYESREVIAPPKESFSFPYPADTISLVAFFSLGTALASYPRAKKAKESAPAEAVE